MKQNSARDHWTIDGIAYVMRMSLETGHYFVAGEDSRTGQRDESKGSKRAKRDLAPALHVDISWGSGWEVSGLGQGKTFHLHQCISYMVNGRKA